MEAYSLAGFDESVVPRKSCFCVPMLSAGCRFPAAGLEQVSIAAATAKRALWKEGSLVFNVSLLGGDAADHGIEVPHTGAHDHGKSRGALQKRIRTSRTHLLEAHIQSLCEQQLCPPAATANSGEKGLPSSTLTAGNRMELQIAVP